MGIRKKTDFTSNPFYAHRDEIRDIYRFVDLRELQCPETILYPLTTPTGIRQLSAYKKALEEFLSKNPNIAPDYNAWEDLVDAGLCDTEDESWETVNNDVELTAMIWGCLLQSYARTLMGLGLSFEEVFGEPLLMDREESSNDGLQEDEVYIYEDSDDGYSFEEKDMRDDDIGEAIYD